MCSISSFGDNQKGFTLLEAVVVLAIFSILGAIAIPDIMSWASKNRLKSAARDVYNVIVKAKSQSVTLHENVALTFGQVIDGDANTYVLYVDDGATGEAYDAGEEILMQVSSWPAGVMLDTSQGGGDGLSFANNADGKPSLSYQPIGTLNGTTGGTVYLINTEEESIKVIVSPTGAVRIE